MNGGLALLLLVVVAGLVDSKPSPDLRERVQARVAELIAKRGKGEGKGDIKGGKGEKDDTDWPLDRVCAPFPDSSLVGKCVSALNWMEILKIDPPTEGVLAEACPKAFKCGEKLLDASEDELKEATESMREFFPLLQCVNLQAEWEDVQISLFLKDKTAEDDLYLKSSASIFAVCDKLFEGVEAEIKELKEDVDEIEAGVEEEKRDAKIKALLRELSTQLLRSVNYRLTVET